MQESGKGMNSLEVMRIFKEILGESLDRFRVPPPSFVTMQGEFLEIDPENGVVLARFPVLPILLNPYGAMQGGMIAAAIDNTIGPLSMFYSPPNVTRRMEIKYSRPAMQDLERILVHARFINQVDSWLYFRADVRDEEGALLARGHAKHWILAEAG